MELHQAIAAAAEAHGDTKNDKSGELYVRHPLRVMEIVADMPSAACVGLEDCMVVAALHDVAEDTEFNLDHGGGAWSLYCSETGIVLGYLTEEQGTALEAMTKREGEGYEDFIERCAADPIATAVKLADIHDNTDPARYIEGPKGDKLRARYAEAKAVLDQATGAHEYLAERA